MKHTIYSQVKCDGETILLRTQGQEGSVTLKLAAVRRVKVPFGAAVIETETGVFRLDLKNFDMAELKHVKEILTEAIRTKRKIGQQCNRP